MQQSITFDTTLDDPAEVLLAAAWAYGYDSVLEALEEGGYDENDDEDAEAVPRSAAPYGWSRAKMRRYVSVLQPTARLVLRAIAERAPQATMEQVQGAVGLEGSAFAGSMSSFGFAARNTRGVREKPFSRSGETYFMDRSVAEVALAALDELNS